MILPGVDLVCTVFRVSDMSSFLSVRRDRDCQSIENKGIQVGHRIATINAAKWGMRFQSP